MKSTKRGACSALLGLLPQHAHATCLNVENTSIPPSTPTSSFSVLGDDTVLAPAMKLMWMRCLVGQTLSGSVCAGTPSLFTWADALNVPKAQAIAGHNDWRLPNVNELISILEDRCYTPSLNADLFPISGLFTAWSSTPSAVNLANAFIEAWAVDGNGFVMRISPVTPLAVLLVRGTP